MASAQLEKSERSKKALLDAARELVIENGYERTTIRAICQKAGFSIGAFYHHFSNKDILLNESFIYFDDTLDSEAFQRYDAMNAVDAVTAVLVDQTAFTEQIGAQLMREYYRALLKEKGTGAIDTGRLYYKTVRRYVEKAQQEALLTDKIDPDDITDFLIRNVRGGLIDWCLHGGNYNVTERTKAELDLLIEPFLR